ncbi:hypothetical protein Naga_100201g8 [Nannochloropsis gaditana]|uniref:GRIP domain-containing protein n=1 Tax=Nannochloropsis gaditana TaxID=72520 RepID=W7TKE7_9STRA|nr:hypothetical protein Naga_100201g8 [Nannochloropsis gaditana]
MDVRPPPRDFRVILQRLQAVLESSASHAQADVEMARRRREEAWGEEKARYLARIAAVEGECRALEEASAASVSAAHREKQRESGEDRGQSHALENTLALAEGMKGEEAAQGEKKSPSTGPGREGEAEELRRRCFQLEAELEGWKGGEPKEVTDLRNETEELRRRCQMLEAESASLRARDSGSERNRTSSGHTPGSIPATTPPSRVSDGEALAQELEEARREAMEWEAAAEARALELKHVRERVMVLEKEQKTAEAQQQEALRVTRATTEAELGHLRAELDRLRGRQGEGEEEEARSEERNRWTREIQRLEHALAEEKQKKTLTHAGSLSESELSKRLAEAAGKLRGKEHEMGQLRVVIEQQRELVKAKAHELERARREGEAHLRRLEAAEEMVKGLVEEKDRHLHALRAADARAQEADLEALREEVAVWKARVATMEANAVRQEEESENKVRGLLERLQAAEHAVHEQGAELAGTRADLGVLTRDFEQSETAKANLQKVLEQFQREKAAEMKHWERTHAKQLAAEAAAAETREAHLRTSFQAQIADAQAQATLSVEESERETRKALAECQQARREAASMRKALDEAIARLHSNESDVVPRQLIGNLVVSYYSQGRPTETLEIIARTLGLADEERIKVGLRALRPGGGRRAGVGEGGGAGSPGKRGLVGGLFSRVGGVMSSPRKEFVPENGTEGKTLGDLWLDYLMKETEEEVEEGEEEEEEEDGGEDQEEKEIAPPDLVSLEAPVLTSVGNKEREGKPPGMGESKALQEEEGDGTGGVIESKVHPPS